jgi:hypothetical protein
MVIAAMFTVIGGLAMLAPGVLYTEGKIMKGLFELLVASLLVIALGSAFFGDRKFAMWLMVGAGGALLLWQCYQQRRWISLHEDALGVVQHVTEERRRKGTYPENLDAYQFIHPEFSAHFDYGLSERDTFDLRYFLNNPGISYWYYPETGFGYHPD